MLNIYYARESTDKEKFIFENITPGSFRRIRNGSWRAYSQMTESAAPTLRNGKNSTA